MSDNIVLIISVSLIIIFSPFFAKVLKLPTTPIEIVLGSIFGYIGFLHEEELFHVVAELGFLYLMFIAGTEINLKKSTKDANKDHKKSTFLFAFFISLFH
jgi:Kef-type K+ transport system membrane component KefB